MLSQLPQTALTGLNSRRGSRTPGPMSPACQSSSQSAKKLNTCGASTPCVSLKTPILFIARSFVGRDGLQVFGNHLFEILHDVYVGQGHAAEGLFELVGVEDELVGVGAVGDDEVDVFVA